MIMCLSEADSIIFIDSLSKSHGVTGLRSGALLTRSKGLRGGVVRYAQNIMAGPSNAMQAVVLGLIGPHASGEEMVEGVVAELIVGVARVVFAVLRFLMQFMSMHMEDADQKEHGE